MNHLAHALLATVDAADDPLALPGQPDAAIVGGLLGDFIKGPLRADDWPPLLAREITLHRRIDAWTDSHAQVRAAVARFHPARRRVAPVALDVFFDHALATRWTQHHHAPLALYTPRVYRALAGFDAAYPGLLPAALRQLAARLTRHDGLRAYAERDTVDFALQRIAPRFSRPATAQALLDCAADLRAAGPALLQDFDAFFPALAAQVGAWRSDWVPAPSPSPGASPGLS